LTRHNHNPFFVEILKMTRPFALFALCACAAFAQQTGPSFEVASVKPGAGMSTGSGGRGFMMVRGCSRPDPGTYRCNNATIKMLLTQAYSVKAFQIEGPGWLDSEMFDINAKLPEGLSNEDATKQLPLMIQNLLAERFQVKLRKENKPLPVFE